MTEETNTDSLLQKIGELETQIHGLEKDLIHDALTGLKTRSFFEEESKTYLEMITHANNNKRKQWFGFKNIAFLFIDVDHFKKINDKYGHDIGDLVLKKVAEVIQKSTRVGDTVSRWGGEEMVVSLLGASLEDAKNKAEDIRKNVESMVFDEAVDLKVTLSVGVVSSDFGNNFEDLVKKADKAMYQSKESGRNKVTVYCE